jgi:hypothetical protein
MGYDINWNVHAGEPVLRHPLYEKYRLQSLTDIEVSDVKADLDGCNMDRDSSGVVAYLCWLIRCKELAA